MTEEIVRCPYCVLGNHLRPMLLKPEGLFICQKCGHTAVPTNPDFKCFCQKCGEMRRHPRFTVSVPVEVHAEGSDTPIRCTTSDLSLGGCYIESTHPFPVGSTLDLRLQLEGTLLIQARVITSYPQVGNGMQFTRMLPEDRAELSKFLDALAKKQELAAAGKK